MANQSQPESFLEKTVGNPWPWMIIGMTLCSQGLWLRLLEQIRPELRLLLVATGMVSAGIAVAIRLSSSETVFQKNFSPQMQQGLVYFLAAAGVLVILLNIIHFVWAYTERDIPWGVTFTTVMTLPISLVWGFFIYCLFFKKNWQQEFLIKQEKAGFLLLFSFCSFLCCWGLFDSSSQVENWITLRLFLTGIGLVTFFGAPLIMMPRRMQRVVISIVILLHFGGILSAVMLPPPSPYIFQQIWARIFRPYLQFMMLNNAYQFYAPEPGPSHYAWFYVEYQNDKGEKKYRWISIPRLNRAGFNDYRVGLQYQRRIAMTDQISQVKNGQLSPYNPRFIWRQINSPRSPGPILGAPNIEAKYEIPFHPSINPPNTQYLEPKVHSQQVAACYAKHIISRPHPDDLNGEWKGTSAKMYRVIHFIPTQDMIRGGKRPDSPDLYIPYYFGHFNAKGEMMDRPIFDKNGMLIKGDPFLYWLIPIIRNPKCDGPEDPEFKNYAFKHAGDPEWVRYPGEEFWQEEKKLSIGLMCSSSN